MFSIVSINNRRIALTRWVTLALTVLLVVISGLVPSAGATSGGSLFPVPAIRSGRTVNGAGSNGQRHRKPVQSWASCLPKDVNSTDSAANSDNSGQTATVGKLLSSLRARCSAGRLLTARGRQIRFVHLLCWGNPPADADEQSATQTRQIAELKKKFTVILLRCDPRTA